MMYGWTITILLVIFALWYLNRGKINFSGKQAKPIDILKKRYASGEITSQEYEASKYELEK